MPASDDLQAEAAWLATRSTADRADYLFEVAHCASRGPDVAEELQRAVGEILTWQPQTAPDSAPSAYGA